MWKKRSYQKWVAYSSKEDQSQQQEGYEAKRSMCGMARQSIKFIFKWRTRKYDISGFTSFLWWEIEVSDLESSYDELYNTFLELHAECLTLSRTCLKQKWNNFISRK